MPLRLAREGALKSESNVIGGSAAVELAIPSDYALRAQHPSLAFELYSWNVFLRFELFSFFWCIFTHPVSMCFRSFPVICFFWFLFLPIGVVRFIGFVFSLSLWGFTRHWKSRPDIFTIFAGGSKHRTVKFADPCQKRMGFITKPSVNTDCLRAVFSTEWSDDIKCRNSQENTWKPASFFASSPWPWYFGDPGEPLSPDFYRWWTPAFFINYSPVQPPAIIFPSHWFFFGSCNSIYIIQLIYIYTHMGLHTCILYIYIYIHYI